MENGNTSATQAANGNQLSGPGTQAINVTTAGDVDGYAELMQKVAAQVQSNPMAAAGLLQQPSALMALPQLSAAAGQHTPAVNGMLGDVKPADATQQQQLQLTQQQAQQVYAAMQQAPGPQTSEAVSNFMSWLASSMQQEQGGNAGTGGLPPALLQQLAAAGGPAAFATQLSNAASTATGTHAMVPFPQLAAAARAGSGTLGASMTPSVSGMAIPPSADRSGSGNSGSGGAGGDGTQDMAGLVHKVQKRLAQNRESARKCRQRRKVYLTQLEEEVVQLRQQHQEAMRLLQQSRQRAEAEARGLAPSLAGDATAAAAAAARGAGLPECMAALLAWHVEYGCALDVVQAAAEASGLAAAAAAAGSTGLGAGGEAADQELAAAVSRCMELLAREKALKAEVSTKAALMLLSGEHLPFEERLLSWMGGIRPSEMLRCVSRDLKSKAMLEPAQEARLARLTESWTAQEDAVTEGYSTLRSRVLFGSLEEASPAGGPDARTAGSAAANSAGASAALGAVGPVSARVLGQLDALRMLLLHADELRHLYYTELCKLLSPHQFAAALLLPRQLCQKVQQLEKAYATGFSINLTPAATAAAAPSGIAAAPGGVQAAPATANGAVQQMAAEAAAGGGHAAHAAALAELAAQHALHAAQQATGEGMSQVKPDLGATQ